MNYRPLPPRFGLLLLLASTLIGSVLVSISWWHTSRIETEIHRQSAELYARAITTFRDFYADEILPRIRGSEVMVRHDYHDQPLSIPIPATLSIDLARAISQREGGLTVEIISPWPFPWRESRQLSPFEQVALEWLSASRQDFYSATTEIHGRRYLQLAAPIRMGATCVACHNSHPDSPRTDWQLGDVRGMQVITMPIAKMGTEYRLGLIYLVTVIVLTFIAAYSVILWLTNKNQLAFAILDSKSRDLEGALRELKSLKRALDEHAIISITDDKERILYANHRFCQLFDLERRQAIGESQYHYMLADEVDAPTLTDIRRITAAGSVWQGEIGGRSSDGGRIWLDATLVPVHGNGANDYRVIAICTDVTWRKRLESHLRVALNEADQANRLKSEFLANMSHEIRTPMNAIIGLSHLAIKACADDRQRGYLDKIQLSARNLLGIINDILDFSKIEAGRMEVEEIPYRLQEVIDQVVSIAQLKAEEKGLTLEVTIDPLLPPILVGDPLRLSQVLLNLIGNAIKFTEHGGVSLQLLRQNSSNQITFRVIDSGIGMSAEQLGRLFQSFTQADASTTRKYGGTGLGLAISRNLVQMMGGDLSVESREGEGSCFSFSLPCREATQLPTQQRHHFSQEDMARLIGGQVLLVEDNLINIQVAGELLEGLGIEVTIARSGVEALQQLAVGNYDLILMDVQMPDMDGFEATRQLRCSPQWQEIPVIALTANAMSGDRERCLAAGMNDYLSKPIDPDELQSMLLRWMPERAQSVPVAGIRSPVADPELPAVIAGIDIDAGIARLRGNKPLYRQILLEFIEEYRHLPSQLQDSRDKQQWLPLLHNLKGVSATVGAQRLSELCAEFERRLQLEADPDLTPLANELQAVVDALLSSGIDNHALAEATLQPRITLDELIAEIASLYPLLDAGDLQVVDSCLAIHPHLADYGEGEVALRIERHVSHFEFEEALLLLQQLSQRLQRQQEGRDNVN
jgi:two-component system, sensor histidine kinase and response regulator